MVGTLKKMGKEWKEKINSKIKGEKNKRKGKKYKRTEKVLEKEQVKEKEKILREGNDRGKANGIKKVKILKFISGQLLYSNNQTNVL
jgi:hypothetical protein